MIQSTIFYSSFFDRFLLKGYYSPK